MEPIEELEMPSETLRLEINGDVVEVSLPNVGGFIDIERRKISLSGGTHKEMLFTSTRSSVYAYSSIEMIATMETLIPDIKKRMRVDSMLQLKPKELRSLTALYNNKIFPWLEKWREFINAPYEESDN